MLRNVMSQRCLAQSVARLLPAGVRPMATKAKSGEWASPESEQGMLTRGVHAGNTPDPTTGAVLPPIYYSTTYVQESVEKYLDKGFSYSRAANPTVSALERRIASLEGGAGATCVGTGMSAVTTLMMGTMKAGDHCVIADCSYGGTNRWCRMQGEPLGMEFTFVDMRDLDNVRKAMRPNTKLVFCETPANPNLSLCDIEAVSDIAHAGGAECAVDTTFATPYILRGLDHKADFVVASTTKFYDGHNITVGGVVVAKTEEGNERMHFVQNMHGNIMSPMNAFFQLNTVKTMGLRIKQQSASAMALATMLESHPKVERVYYPGLASFPQKELADRYHRNGLHGSMLWFDVEGGDKAAIKLMNMCPRPWSLCENLGATESIITACAVMTHANMLKEDRLKVGISDGFIRISTGIEDTEDLISSLKASLDAL